MSTTILTSTGSQQPGLYHEICSRICPGLPLGAAYTAELNEGEPGLSINEISIEYGHGVLLIARRTLVQ